jgi:hypothetical protein
MSARDLLQQGPRVVNIGLAGFAEDLDRQRTPVVAVDWMPPLASAESLDLLERLSSDAGVRARVDEANQEALRRMLATEPVLVDVLRAGDTIQRLDEGVVLHAGPPIDWERMCGPMRGAVAGAIVLEGWAPDLESAARLAGSGEIEFHPNQHFDTVGPMTGITTASMPVMVVENRAFGNRAYCALNEGLGKVMRFGGNDAQVLERLRWLAEALAPALSAALRDAGGLGLKGIVARGLSMGDEMHQRNVGCTSLLLRELAPALARTSTDAALLEQVLAFIGGNDQFFLNVAMVMGKATMDPVRGIADSSVVTAMSRNGTDFGIRVSGTGDTWFVAPVEMPQGLYFPGYTQADANPDMGDSTIVETIGLGGFAMAAAPAVAGFVGAGDASEAGRYTRRMYEITVGRNPEWSIPALNFAGVPSAIDMLAVVELGIVPTINTGIAHREPGVGQVGAGIVNAPFDCFEQALKHFAGAHA